MQKLNKFIDKKLSYLPGVLLLCFIILGITMPSINAKAADITTFTDGMTYDEDSAITSDINITSDVTINVNSLITQNNKITIANGGTLRIKGTGTFKRGDSFTLNMFDIQAGGKLIIEGDSEKNKITIDGNASWSSNQVGTSTRYVASVSEGSVAATNAAIHCASSESAEASFSLKNVKMQNLYTISGESAAINVNSSISSKYSTIGMENVDVTNCITKTDKSIVLLDGANVTMKNCTFTDNFSCNQYAGVIKASGNQFCVLNMEECSASGNYSSGWGGVILWAASYDYKKNVTDETTNETTTVTVQSKATLNKCNFDNNIARYLGGAISNEATMLINNCRITNNTAMSGGGIAVFPFTLTKDGDSGTNACGLTLGSGNVIQGNKSVAKESFSPFSKKDTAGTDPNGDEATLADPPSYPAGGGGIWCYMNKDNWDCTFNIGSGNTISQNEANVTGGGVYVHQNAGKKTTLSITGATISNNTAAFGGGVALKNEDSSKDANLTISDGTITGNEATSFGGGAYVDNGTCNISGEGSINNNTAQNGGGVYINQGTMNVTGGYIIANQANGSTQNTTAYESAENAGVGGGVYLNSGTFKMIAEGTVGLYGNLASFAADDVYANPSNTSWAIPKVENMNLSNFGQSVGTVTGWYEDYSSQDSKYSDGLNGGKYDDGSDDIMRYRSADNEHKIENTQTTMENTYVCLTLGYELNKYPLKIKKDVTGAGGETDKEFEFTIVVTRSDGTEYDLFTDSDDNSFSLADNEEQSFLIPYGYTYTIVETDYTNEGYDTYINQSEEKSNSFTDEMDVTTEKTVSFENRYRSVNVTVTKKVTGNLGDQSKDFNFTCVVKDKNNSTYTTGVPASFTLKHDGTQVITIPYGYSIEIVESDYSSEKYKTTVDGTETNEYKGTITTDTSVVYENNKQAEVDTGVDVTPNSTFLPMMLIIVCLTTAGRLTLYLLKRRRFY